MSQAHFSLTYDGDAVRDGEIDVADLAPALLALAQAVKSTGKVVLGSEADVSLKIRTMKSGSFEVLMNAVVNGDVGLFWNIVKQFYASEDAQTALAVVETLFAAGAVGSVGYAGVVRFLQWRRGRALQRQRRLEGGATEVTIDGDTLTLAPGAFEAAQDPAVRTGLEKSIAEPLDRDGIDEVRFANGSDPITVKKEDREFFRSSNATDDEFASTYEKVFSIVTLSFRSENKWKLHDGQGTRFVTISDEEFLAKIDAGEKFGKGDLLHCLVKEVSARTASGSFKSQYEILKVIEHKPFSPPAKLDL